MGEKTTGSGQISVRELQACDITKVRVLDQEAFYDPWSNELWVDELNNGLATYLVLEEGQELLGYAGYWLVAGEAQVIRVAVAKKRRNQGLGKLLTRAMIDHAWARAATSMTLEVRQGNAAAQKVYLDCGFVSAGIRPHYYADNHENALIMWLYREEH